MDRWKLDDEKEEAKNYLNKKGTGEICEAIFYFIFSSKTNWPSSSVWFGEIMEFYFCHWKKKKKIQIPIYYILYPLWRSRTNGENFIFLVFSVFFTTNQYKNSFGRIPCHLNIKPKTYRQQNFKMKESEKDVREVVKCGWKIGIFLCCFIEMLRHSL